MGKCALFIMLLAGLVVGGLWADGEAAQEGESFALPLVLNVVPGLGIGSFVQKDPLGGFVGLGGEVVGATMVGYGCVYVIVAAVGTGLIEALTGGAADTSGIDFTVARVCVLSGMGIWAGTKIFEIVRPIMVTARRNRGERAEATAVAQAFTPQVGLLLGTTNDGGTLKVNPGLSLSLRY